MRACKIPSLKGGTREGWMKLRWQRGIVRACKKIDKGGSCPQRGGGKRGWRITETWASFQQMGCGAARAQQ